MQDKKKPTKPIGIKKFTLSNFIEKMKDPAERKYFYALFGGKLAGVGVCFLPHDEARRAEIEALVERTIADEGQQVVAWRDVPHDDRHVGAVSKSVMPVMRQVFVGAAAALDPDGLAEGCLWKTTLVGRYGQD